MDRIKEYSFYGTNRSSSKAEEIPDPGFNSRLNVMKNLMENLQIQEDKPDERYLLRPMKEDVCSQRVLQSKRDSLEIQQIPILTQKNC